MDDANKPERPIAKREGILLINKPRGMSSHDVVNAVRRATGERRVGHAGTLDPLADGLMIVLVGRENTKRQREFLEMDKEYVAKVTFGIISETYDSEGPFSSEQDASTLTEEAVVKAIASFIGEQTQTPPAHSAVKVGGRRAYQAARKGEKQVIPKRHVTVYEAELTSFVPGAHPVVTIRYHVSSGTYIRSLAHDLGQMLGTGAYLSALTRTRIGEFLLKDAIDIEAL